MSLNGGYAMIKYNSTQEELQIAYRSKKPALFYDENQRAHWAAIEEKATQSVDEETQEPITIYEYSYRLLDEESSVVANPTLSGDESNLTGLEVDGIKYKVSGSGGSGTITLDDIVDYKGNKRFIGGNGTHGEASGLTITNSKWVLNGSNLIFQIEGAFSGVLSEIVAISIFTIENWISDKIGATSAGFIDFINCDFVSSDMSVKTVKIAISKSGNRIHFESVSNITISNTSFFKIRYNTIIDND